jgi:hypothetical protein
MLPTPLGYYNSEVNIINIMLRSRKMVVIYVSKHAQKAAASAI